MKRFLTLMLVFALALSTFLVGCGADKQTKDNTQTINQQNNQHKSN
ncbi:hypothetical protein [Tepidibacillus marianensis]